jgi:hypothetical protein
VRDPLYSHVSDYLLERYVRGRLPDNDFGAVGDHLMICRDCRERLMDSCTFVETLDEAARALGDPARPNGPVYFRMTIARSW